LFIEDIWYEIEGNKIKYKKRKICNMLFSELKSKEVINMKDCKKLGHVCDLEFDHCTGCISKIIVPGKGKLFTSFCNETEYVISYSEICKIGPDIILVNI